MITLCGVAPHDAVVGGQAEKQDVEVLIFRLLAEILRGLLARGQARVEREDVDVLDLTAAVTRVAGVRIMSGVRGGCCVRAFGVRRLGFRVPSCAGCGRS